MTTIPVASGRVGTYANTIAAGVMDTVNFADDLEEVEVVTDGAAALYYTVDGTTPTVGGTNCWELPAGNGYVRTIQVPTAGPTVVKLISSGTPKYSVSRAR